MAIQIIRFSKYCQQSKLFLKAHSLQPKYLTHHHRILPLSQEHVKENTGNTKDHNSHNI